MSALQIGDHQKTIRLGTQVKELTAVHSKLFAQDCIDSKRQPLNYALGSLAVSIELTAEVGSIFTREVNCYNNNKNHFLKMTMLQVVP